VIDNVFAMENESYVLTEPRNTTTKWTVPSFLCTGWFEKKDKKNKN